MVEDYIDLNILIFEMQQGDASAAPKTSSGTMMMEDFGQRRSKSKLRDVEASLKRLGKLMYHLAKSHYDFKKTFRIAQPNNDITEYTINKKLYDDKTKELQTIENNLAVVHLIYVLSATLPCHLINGVSGMCTWKLFKQDLLIR